MLVPSLQMLVKFRVLIYCAFFWLLQSILIIICVSSTHWVTGKTSRGSKQTVAMGLFNFCVFDENEVKLECQSYTSNGWVDFTKALLIMPLLMLWMFVPCAMFLGIDEPTAKSHLSIARGNYRISLYLLVPLLVGSTQAFLKGYKDYLFLKDFKYGWSFYLSIIVTLLAILQPIIYAILYKLFPSFLRIAEAAEEDAAEGEIHTKATPSSDGEETTGKSSNDFKQIEIGIENESVVHDEQNSSKISIEDLTPPP